ncbi:MAG TPA: hypothetical protein VGY55_05815 [Pirellulales bacterium]|nr:hypothetical protein [Pirellulales bacterium]
MWFHRRDDRWMQFVEVRRDGRMVACLASAEGESGDEWPPSPPFQNLELQTIPGKAQTALLVGKAGSSHWSAAVEADPTAGVLRFDVACRIQNEPSRLGSSYWIGANPKLPPPALPRFEMTPIGDGVERRLDVTDREVAIRVLSDTGPLPRTIRWQYVISFPE